MQINNTEILNFSSYLSDEIISLFSLNKSKLTYLDLIDRYYSYDLKTKI